MDFAIRFLIVISTFGVTSTALTMAGLKTLPRPMSPTVLTVLIGVAILLGCGATQYAYKHLLKDHETSDRLNSLPRKR